MNPEFEPMIYSLRDLRGMKQKILSKGINSWNHTNYSLICQLISILEPKRCPECGAIGVHTAECVFHGMR